MVLLDKREIAMDCPTDWVLLVSVIACLFAVLGVIVGLFMHLANKMDGIRSEMHSMRLELNSEIKDFHGRLCTIEERNRA